MSEERKICNVCQEEKQLSDFYFRKETGRYRSNCKKCKPLMSKADIIAKANAPTKVCKDCGIEKPVSEYQKAGGGKWNQPYCKPCDSERKKRHTEENRDVVMAKKRAYTDKNREAINEKNKEYYRANSDKVKEYQKRYAKESAHVIKARYEKKKERDRIIRESKKEEREALSAKKRDAAKIRKREKRRLWCNMKSATDVNFRLLKNVRGRIRFALLSQNTKKLHKTEEILGCSIPELKLFIESQFTEGMSWDNYKLDGWHLDHRIPISWFNLSNENCRKLAFSYKNLQPMWWQDNLSKQNKFHHKLAS